METIPIKTRIMNAFRPKDEPSGVCPSCEQDDQEEMDPRWRPIVDWVKEQGHSEEEAREIVRRMADTLRRDFPLPPEDPEPQKGD